MPRSSNNRSSSSSGHPVQSSAAAARPPRGELFASDSARAVWAGFESLPEELKGAFADFAQAHVAVPEARNSPDSRRVARAVGALREASELLAAADSASPSQPSLVSAAPNEEPEPSASLVTVAAYEALRAEYPHLGWPPASSVRRWLGGRWNDALRRARLPTVADGDAVTRFNGPKFTSSEVLDAIRQCMDEVDECIGLTDYVHWSRRPDVRRRPGRRPQSQHVFDQLFGGWRAARAAALGNPNPSEHLARMGTNRPPQGYRYTEQEMLDAVREVARENGGRAPRSGRYAHLREVILQREREAGRPARGFPSYGVLNARFGMWDAALAAAGLEPFGDPAMLLPDERSPMPRKPGQRRMSDEQMCDLLREAHAAQGEPFTVKAYEAWRKQVRESDEAAGREPRRIPVYGVVWRRYRAWKHALTAAGLR